MKKAEELLSMVNKVSKSKAERTKTEMEAGLKFWVLDYAKSLISNNKDMMDRTKYTIEGAIKKKDLDRDLVFNYFGDPKDSDYEATIKREILKANLPDPYQL